MENNFSKLQLYNNSNNHKDASTKIDSQLNQSRGLDRSILKYKGHVGNQNISTMKFFIINNERSDILDLYQNIINKILMYYLDERKLIYKTFLNIQTTVISLNMEYITHGQFKEYLSTFNYSNINHIDLWIEVFLRKKYLIKEYAFFKSIDKKTQQQYRMEMKTFTIITLQDVLIYQIILVLNLKVLIVSIPIVGANITDKIAGNTINKNDAERNTQNNYIIN